MKCNQQTSLVCTSWEKCDNARKCLNVTKGIKNNLNEIDEKPAFIKLGRKLIVTK